MSEGWRNTYDKLFITDRKKQKEWDELDPVVKKATIDNLEYTIKKTSLETGLTVVALAINELHHAMLELDRRIKSLES